MKIKTKQIIVQNQNVRRAFTLVEMLLVVTIIGILAALVIPKIVGTSEQARITAAQADINGGIKSALDAVRSGQRILSQEPAGFDGRSRATPRTGTGRICDKLPVDPWGNPYIYYFPGKHNPPATTCCRSGRTARKARTMTLATGQNEIRN